MIKKKADNVSESASKDATTISDVDDKADITLGVPVLSTTFSVNSYTILFLSLINDLYILVLNRLP